MSTSTKITEITNKAACAAWCPIKAFPGLVALGSKDSGGNIGFDSTCGELELYSISLTPGDSPILEGKVAAAARFVCVAWTPYQGGKRSGDDNNSNSSPPYPMGLIAGGMTDGTIQLYNPAAIKQSKNENDKEEMMLIGSIKAQAASGPMGALQFSPLDIHLLCAGASNGRVSILDCSDPTKPTSMEPGPPGQHSVAEITSIAWNPCVAHIVSTAAGDGVVTVWDIQSKTAWCEIRAESAGQAVADVCWHPGQGLHLLTASADDRNPVLRVWDLGSSTSVPLATLSGHTAGIFRAAWCPHDDNLIVSVSKDNRTFLWDLASMQAVAELPIDSVPDHHHGQQHQQAGHSAGSLFASGRPGLHEQKQLRYDVKWSPFQRGVALTCGLDKKVQIHTLLALATYAGRPPAWMRPKGSISTGFGGILVSCSAGKGPTVTIRTIQEQPALAETSIALETDLAYYQSVSVIDFCKLQQQNATTTEDIALWGFMQVVFETNSRQELLLHLGYDANEVVAAAEQYTHDLTNNGISNLSLKDNNNNDNEPLKPMSAATQDIVKKALLVGNFEAAVQCCVETGNFSDALMLASCGGGDLWAKTQERYFASELPKRPYLSLVSGILRNEWEDFVSKSDTSMWQETLAVLATYPQQDAFPNLCIMLGDRLYEIGEDSNASLCYMCALNLDRSVMFWRKQLSEKADPGFSAPADLIALHEFVVKVSTFVQAPGSSAVLTPEIEDLFSKYSQALAEQGLLVTATKYCRGTSTVSRELRDRLYRSRASHRCYHLLGSAPDFPFTMVDVQQSRGQVLAQPIIPKEAPVVQTHDQDYGQYHTNQQQHGYSAETQSHGHQQQGMQFGQHNASAQDLTQVSDALPHGWVAIQDPGSGNTYYANSVTGETTWDRPMAAAPAPASLPAYATSSHETGMDTSQRSVQAAQAASTKLQQKPSLVSKYGDGFVSSASNPELAYQYGNVGTSNPYGGSARPGTAAAVIQTPQKAPVSGSLNFDSLQLSNHHNSIKETLLAAASALDATSLAPVERRQLSEAEKAIAILVKKLARDGLSAETVDQVFALVGAVSQRDFATALAYQTTLANSEWRDHKDWLKGLKILLQLAAKKL